MDTTAEIFLAPISNLFPRLLEEIGVTPRNFGLLTIVEKELEHVNFNAKIVGFSQNKFFVEVESSVELYELNLKKREILKAVRDVFPKDSLQSPPEINFFLKGMAHPEQAKLKKRN